MKYLFAFLLAVIIGAGFFLAFLVEDDSCGGDGLPASTDDAVRSRKLARRAVRVFSGEGASFSFVVSEDELNSLFIFMNRGVRRLSGRAELVSGEVRVCMSLKLPESPLGQFVNFSFNLPSSTEGLLLSGAKIGAISIPGEMALTFLRVILNLGAGEHFGDLLVEAVRSVSVNSNKINMQIGVVPDLKGRAADIGQRLMAVRDKAALLGDPLLVRDYYAELIEIDRRIKGKNPVSLAQYVGPLFSRALEQGGDPVSENRAAVLALAMFLGSKEFENFIGPVRTPEMKKYRRQRRKIVLAGREDLRLHFLISAGLKFMSDRDISNAIGEFKELLDAGKGGSGFSFADLAADRAGILFAGTATAGPTEAKAMQQVLGANEREDIFFPDVGGLPEGLSQQDFERIYGNVESEKYKALTESIDKCLEKLPAFLNESYQDLPLSGRCRMSQTVLFP